MAPGDPHSSTGDGVGRPGSTPDITFWRGRRVLLTGHTGFKGTWLAAWLCDLGADVLGVSLPGHHGDPCLWDQVGLTEVAETRSDVADDGWRDAARAFSPEVVLHLAAQSLVSVGYVRPADTFRTNVLGTSQVLTLAGELDELQATVVVTTDKVYDVRQPAPYREDAFLGGKDPYSASKAAAELVTHSWPGTSAVGTARAGNVIGGGDWALDRIVPDLVRAWSADRAVVLRRPTAVRPWQHVIEPLAGYLAYAEALAAGRDVPTALNFGPDEQQAAEVIDLVELAAGVWRELVPGSDPRWEILPEPHMAETHTLTLDPDLAVRTLGWRGVWTWQQAVDRSLRWYLRAAAGEDARGLMRAQVAEYTGAVS